jgi:hypothetical protein
MQTSRNNYFLLNYVFVLCIFVLALNDHLLKFAYANWFTGKLSDAVGIILLPLLLAYLLPPLKNVSLPISALLFVFWKSPASQPFIDWYNQYAWIPIWRIVDYSDLLVFLLLPIPYLLINKMDELECLKVKKVQPRLVLLPTILVLMATSPPLRYSYTRTEGNLQCYKCAFTVNYQQDEIVEKLKNVGIAFDSIAPIDTTALRLMPQLNKENVHFYRINQLVIDQDTLRKLDFTMRTVKGRKTKIYLNGMQVSEDISSFKLERKLRNYYKGLLFKELKSKLKQ